MTKAANPLALSGCVPFASEPAVPIPVSAGIEPVTGMPQSALMMVTAMLDDESLESRSILTSVLLIAVIFAGFVVAFSLAEVDPMLTDTLSTILH